MPIGAKMYEAASKDAEESVASDQESEKGKKSKKDKSANDEEPVEGEVVDDKEEK